MTPLSVAEARAAAIGAMPAMPAVRLPLERSVAHRLATAVVAPWPLPRWTAASMDGWAVQSADLDHDGAVLSVAGGGDAGDGPPPPLGRGSAWRVATGGRVPEGADSVIRQEDATLLSQREQPAVRIDDRRDLRRNVRPLGGDIAADQVALPAGSVITPGTVALLAALGVASPQVFRKPRVALLCSGNEVVGFDRSDDLASGRRIADANTPMLTALIQQCGAEPLPLGLVADDPEAIATAVASAQAADLVMTAGGISVGRQDHIPAAMERLAARLVFRRVRIRPGGPTTLALLPDGRPWLALPGNPVSAYVTFRVFAAAMLDPDPAGTGATTRYTDRGILAEPVDRDPTLDLYLRVRLDHRADALPLVRRTGDQGSWLTSSIAQADALMPIEAGAGTVAAGTEVSLL